MSAFADLLGGFSVALTPENLLFAAVGVTLGTLIGVLPGVGPALTIALLLPLTYTFEPTAAFITFAGIYYGAMYGGSTTSILLNTPGESASIVTALEGNKMARAGRGAQALATAAIGSFVAGLIATLLLAFTAPAMVNIAIKLGAPDYFALMVLAFVAVGTLLGKSVPRGLAALGLGLFIGLIGIDFQTGQARYTFGQLELLDGIDVVLVVVGLFAIGETLYLAARIRTRPPTLIPIAGGRTWLSREDFRRSWKPWLRGTAIGFPMGVIPAGGSEIPTFLSYAAERKLSKHPEEFGKGAIEGVAGPEATNNATAAGALVPLLTLGIPTSATAAVILVAFQQYGLQPGPRLFESESTLVWGLLASLLIGNLLLLVLNLPLVGVWVKLLKIPTPYLYSGILMFAMLGGWVLNQNRLDLIIMLIIGVVGLLMRRYGFPIAPTVVGVILGPLAEIQLRRALAIGGGEPSALLDSPFAVVVLCLAALVVVLPPTVGMIRRIRGRRESAEAAVREGQK